MRNCGLHGRFDATPLKPYAPTLAFHGTADEETSSKRCARPRRAEPCRRRGPIEMVLYSGATHGFDAPDARRQAVDANIPAAKDATARALAFFGRHLRP